MCPPLSIWLHMFRDAGHEKRMESSWSGPWHLGCTLEVFRVHSYQDQFIQPFLAEGFCVFSLGLCFVCSFVLFDLFVCHHSFMYPWAVESSPAPCRLRGCKNGFAPFLGWMSYKPTKPGLVSVLYLSTFFIMLVFIRAAFYQWCSQDSDQQDQDQDSEFQDQEQDVMR